MMKTLAAGMTNPGPAAITPNVVGGFPFFELKFDSAGEPLFAEQADRLIAESKRTGVTDLIFLAHGFRCDTAEATRLYTNLLTNLRPSLTEGNFAAAGIYWPSQKFRESFGHPTALHSHRVQDAFVASILAAVGEGDDDPCEGLPLLRQFSGSELLARLQPAGLSTADAILGGLDTFLNFMSWMAMKNLSGEVGARGLAATVLACQRKLPLTRFHLAGHSLGGRLVAACCKALAQQRAVPIASLSLLEAAFSHFGFSPDAGRGQRGFFRDVIENKIVGGPMIATFSKRDTVVGTAYAVASRLARDRLQAIGDAADPYGGIGHNGAQRTPESTTEVLHRAGDPYRFRPGSVACLDGSAGLITAHSDVTNPHVTYAIASAIRGSA